MAEHVIIRPFVVPIVEDENHDEREWVLGEWRSRPTPHILVEPGLTGINRPMTIFHESLHGVSDYYGLNLAERTVRVLEVSITNFIRDNPDLIRDLQT